MRRRWELACVQVDRPRGQLGLLRETCCWKAQRFISLQHWWPMTRTQHRPHRWPVEIWYCLLVRALERSLERSTKWRWRQSTIGSLTERSVRFNKVKMLRYHTCWKNMTPPAMPSRSNRAVSTLRVRWVLQKVNNGQCTSIGQKAQVAINSQTNGRNPASILKIGELFSAHFKVEQVLSFNLASKM